MSGFPRKPGRRGLVQQVLEDRWGKGALERERPELRPLPPPLPPPVKEPPRSAGARESAAGVRPRPFSVATLATHWGCDTQLIYDLITSGELRAWKLGGKLLRIDPDEVRRYEQRGR